MGIEGGNKRKKEGRGFFLVLIIGTGIVILAYVALKVKGKDLFIFAFQRFVINKALVALLSKEYTFEKLEAVRLSVYEFYEAAKRSEVDDESLWVVSTALQRAMADEKITREEIDELLTLTQRRQRFR